MSKAKGLVVVAASWAEARKTAEADVGAVCAKAEQEVAVVRADTEKVAEDEFGADFFQGTQT